MRSVRGAAGVLIGLAVALGTPPVATADPAPYSLPAGLPAPGTSPATASDAPFTPTVVNLLKQLEPSQPDPVHDAMPAPGTTPMQLQNAATILHGIATVPLASESETCNTIGGNNAPTGTNPVI